MKSTQRTFKVEILVTSDCETLQSGMEDVKKMFKDLCLKVQDIKPVINHRTDQQNSALHLWFTQVAEIMRENNIDMKQVLKEGFEFPATPYAIKEFIWRPTMIAMFGKKSTTKLDKLNEINEIIEVINRALIERTNGMVNVPPLPSYNYE